jgi:hypothetical protein
MSNCLNCFFCCNLVNSKYKVFNKQYSKEDYHEIKDDILKRFKNYDEFKSLEESYNKFLEHNFISSSLNISNCEKSV